MPKLLLMFLRMLALVLMLAPLNAAANEKLVRLHAPEPLIETGLFKHMLPRFTLKTQVRVELVAANAADLVLGDAGRAVFQGPGQVWRLQVRAPDHPGTARLTEWLRSDVGQRTIASFQPEGSPLFGPPAEGPAEEAEVAIEGDQALGHKVSRAKCTRCHAVDAATAGWGIGSTPSFGVLRALPDWEARFAAFYTLNPHPAFTQIVDLTAPFPIDRPSPIAPIELTLEDVEAMLAYVSAMPKADLGQPIEHQ